MTFSYKALAGLTLSIAPAVGLVWLMADKMVRADFNPDSW